MYGIIYTSDQYYDNNTQLDPLIESNKECIICWLTSSEVTHVKCMKNHFFFVSSCNCNAYIHDTCLQKWINKQSSCPICRTKIFVNIIENKDYYIKIRAYFVILLNNTFYVLKMLSFFSMVNLFFLLFYNIIFLDFTLDDYQYEYPDECRENFYTFSL